MPLLDRTGSRDDAWQRVTAATLDGVAHPIVPWAELPAALAAAAPGQPIGVDLPNNVAWPELALLLRRLALVSVRFPSFADGRGFSLAKRIRGHGFAGTLRAHGPIIADQFVHALACGFDEVELPDDLAARQPPAQWLAALERVSDAYPRGYAGPQSILDRRRQAQGGTP